MSSLPSKKALLLLNMGGPNNLEEVKVFLKNMFNDKHILAIPSPFRAIVAAMITRGRLSEAKENYKAIGGKSPLPEHTKRLVCALQDELPTMRVEAVMRYTPPFGSDVLASLKKDGIEQLILMPLYPHFSDTTTASSFEDIEKSCQSLNYHPELIRIDHYYERQLYTDAVVERIKEHFSHKNSEEYVLIFSAHGLPQRVIDKGDPYQKHIEADTKRIQNRLEACGVRFKSYRLAYQSKVGPLKWIEPSLEACLETLKGEKVALYPIAFTIDNSETDFELRIEYEEIAATLGMKAYDVIPCLNDSSHFVHALASLAQEHV